MDLRPLGLSPEQVERAVHVLDYQPFVISDDIQTGAGYSWINGGDPRVAPQFVFRRSECEADWPKISDANRRVATMYDDFVSEIARRYPGGSLLDVACNNGYFPVRASLLGMSTCVGADIARRYAKSVAFLNKIAGSRAKFRHAAYNPRSHTGLITRKYDVVVASAILCHLPDPLNFLAHLGTIARHAIFFWGQLVETDGFVIAYSPPHPNLSPPRPFPYAFNDNTRISRGLFEESMRQMGFREVVEIPSREGWLWHHSGAAGKPELEHEVKYGSRHFSLLAIR